MPYLIVRELGSEQLVPLADIEITVGRSRQNAIKLFTEQASRRHCRVFKTDKGAFKVEDAKSSNGTYVNGLKVETKELIEGDQISIGHATIVYKAGDPPAPAPAPPPAESATMPIPIEDRNVQILLNTVISAANSENLDSFLRTAVDNVIEIAHAERGILFLKDARPVGAGPGAQPLPGAGLFPVVPR